MRVVIQRVTGAEVQIDQAMKARIAHGLLLFAGFEEADNADDIDWTVRKIAQLRIFDDEQGIMNRSVTDIRGNSWWSVSSPSMLPQKKATDLLTAKRPVPVLQYLYTSPFAPV
jgi:D-tyrosyl-tRNA(Tyr) deacylase